MPLPLFTQGANTIKITSTASGARQSSPTIVNFTMDTVLPVINFATEVSSGSVVSDTINITVVDTYTNTGSLKYGFSDDTTCDNTDTYSNTFVSGTNFVINNETDNDKYICVYASDNSGNIAYMSSTYPLNIETADNDNDGISDSVDLDDDNDGVSDVDEIELGMDPLDDNSNPAASLQEVIEDIAGNTNGTGVTDIELNSIEGVSGAVNGIDYSDALENGYYINPAHPTSAEIKAVIEDKNTSPTIPTISNPTNGSPVTGTAEAGSIVKVITPSGATCTTTVDNNGDYYCTLSSVPVDGENITISSTDRALNITRVINIGIIDILAPVTPIIMGPTNGSPVGGIAEVGSRVNVTTPSGSICTTIVATNGEYSCILSPLPVDGEDIVVTVTDSAGNSNSVLSNTGIDRIKPDIPVITQPTNGESINDTTPHIY